MAKTLRTQKEKSDSARRSKRKGKRGEKNAAILVSLWWTGEEGNFVSTPGSGALRWKKGVAKVVADLVPIESDQFPEFPYSIEVKNREKWDLESTFKGNQIFWGWWQQACDDGIRASKAPMLLFTKNYSPCYIALDWSEIKYYQIPGNMMKITDPEKPRTCMIMLATEFFNLNIPKHIKKKDPLRELLERFKND